MTKEEIRDKAKMTTACYFDNYCGTGFVMCAKGFLEELSKEPANHDTMAAVLEGVMEGLAKVEKAVREGTDFYKPGPLQRIEDRILEDAKPQLGIVRDAL